MKRIFVPTQTGSDWQRLLAKPSLHWSVGRSAMTAAACWETAADKLPQEISALLDATKEAPLLNLRLIAAIPEWEVPLPGGSRSSFSDVLALARNDSGLCAIAVEAKAGEDFGPTVQEKRSDASAGQLARLEYLQSLLGAKFDASVRYQLLHRTASAILAAQEFHAGTAIMLVHAWKATDEQRHDFRVFSQALCARLVAPGVACVDRFAGPSVYLAWCDGDPQFALEELPSAPSARGLLTALHFAADKHRMQRRKDPDASPYINHPIAVAQLLADSGVSDAVTLGAAILHDTIEDTETSYEELIEKFGPKVADTVMEVTDDKSLPKQERKRLQVEHASRMSRSAALVKLADKTCNLRDMAAFPPESWSLQRRQEYFDWAAAVVQRLPRVNEKLDRAFEEAMRARP